MNNKEMSQVSQNSVQRNQKKNIFAGGNWEASGKLVCSLLVPTKLRGGKESFLEKSEMFPVLMEQVNADEISITDLILLSQTAKAIEDGDTRAATFVRDTSGGKPIDKQEVNDNRKIVDLPDNVIEYMLNNAKVINKDE